MTPVVGISPIMFDRYNDNLGTFDYVMNGVRKIGYSAYSNSGLNLSELGWSIPNFFNSRFYRIGEPFCRLSIKVNCIPILFSSLREVSVFHWLANR
jgi:hypothetical protein